MDEEEVKARHLRFFGIPKLFPYLKRIRKYLFLMLGLSVAAALTDTLFPLFQQYAINNFIAKDTTNGLVLFVVIYLACLVFKIGTDCMAAYFGIKTEMYLGKELKQDSFDHLQTLSFSYFNRNSVGYIHSRVSSDTNRLGVLLSWYLFDTAWQFVYMIGAFVIMFMTNAKLSLIILAVIPVEVAIVALMQKKIVTVNRKIRELNSRITGNFNEGITGAKTIKTLVAEDKMYREFTEKTSSMKKFSVRDSRYRGVLMTVTEIAAFVTIALILKVGGGLSSEKIMEVGTLSMFMSYAVNIMIPIQYIVGALSQLVVQQVNIERFFGLMETESDVTDTPEVVEKYGDIFDPKPENWEELKGDIRFENVSFKYPDGDELVLEDFSLDVPHGTNVAIVGETGAGKSTLVNLVCRFFEPTTGRILIDGRDERERSQSWLHSNIGYVLQSPHLFSGTIRDNMRYGLPDATDEQIIEALKTVQAYDIVEKSEKGLDTEVGEGGDNLSTGQKQLISFARAIISDPRILILDEATSSIDTLTEQIIQSSIKEVIRGRTSFVIAHRLSTVRDADVILVVRHGKIVERGTHRQLMKLRGYYYDLYTQQFRAEATESFFSSEGKPAKAKA